MDRANKHDLKTKGFLEASIRWTEKVDQACFILDLRSVEEKERGCVCVCVCECVCVCV